MNKNYKSEVWLRQRYVVQRKNIKEIAAECGCSTSTIQNYLIKFNLIRNTRSWK